MEIQLFDINKPGTLDGGDVLRVNTDMFVGISERTNKEAVNQISKILSPYGIRVYGVPVGTGGLHLKSLITALDSQTLVVARGVGLPIRQTIEQMDMEDLLATEYGYVFPYHHGTFLCCPPCFLLPWSPLSIQLILGSLYLLIICRFIEVTHPLSANVLRVNNYVFIQPANEEDREILITACEERGLTPVEMDMSETAKADGALTCCSILLP